MWTHGEKDGGSRGAGWEPRLVGGPETPRGSEVRPQAKQPQPRHTLPHQHQAWVTHTKNARKISVLNWHLSVTQHVVLRFLPLLLKEIVFFINS